MLKSTIKNFIKQRLGSLVYFYKKLGNKIFLSMFMNIGVGILDGFGLAMFMPLLQMVGDSSTVDEDTMGGLSFLVDAMKKIGFKLNLVNVLIVICSFFLLKGIAQFVNGAYATRIRVQFIRQLRKNLIKLLNSITYKSFVKFDIGRIQNSMTGEAGQVVLAYQNYFMAFQQLVLVIVYMLFAFFVDVKFAILIVIGGGLSNLLFKRIYKTTKSKSAKLTNASNSFQGLTLQYISNYKYLKATGSIKKYENKLGSGIEHICKNQWIIGFLASIVSAIREPILITIVSLIIIVQVQLMGGSLATILVSLLFFYRALTALMQMQGSYNVYLGATGSLTNIKDFESELSKAQENRKSQDIQQFKEKLELCNAYFKFDNSYIVKNINLIIRKNQSVAFVGESGSGKTTLVNILTGLLPLNDGTYSIDGFDINKININAFQQRIGYITQEAVIFNDTIFNNVTFWDEKTYENIERFNKALKMASCYDFIYSLPKKEESVLGNNGINISGGQKQRISIARELYKDVEILILDEATSALDSETEKIIQSSIECLKGKYTIIMIAHRLSTIKNVDQIFLMENGIIQASGNFNELKSISEKFTSMISLQQIER